MYNHEIIIPDIMCHYCKLLDIKPVKPSHLDSPTFRFTMVMEVRDHHIVIEFVPIHPDQVEETDVVVGVAMNHNSRSLGLGGI